MGVILLKPVTYFPFKSAFPYKNETSYATLLEMATFMQNLYTAQVTDNHTF
jgi:hypothetical protein